MHVEPTFLTPAQQKKRNTCDALAGLVDTRWNAAVSARAWASQQMAQAHRVLQGQPVSGKHLDVDIPIVLNISASMHRGIVSLINDAFTAASDDLFVVKPTALPTLTDEDTQRIQSEVAMTIAMQEGLTGEPVDQEEADDIEEQITQGIKDEIAEEAIEAAQELADIVRDEFQENGWLRAIPEAVSDMIAYPAMILKSPAAVFRKHKQWVDGRMVVTSELMSGVERIAPWNFYPAPNARDVQSADYIFEVRTISANELIALAADLAYDADEIKRVFDEHPTGYKHQNKDTTTSLIEEPNIFTLNNTAGFYEVRVMYGKVVGSTLEELGVMGTEAHRQYEAQVAIIGSCVIRATLGNDSSGSRPFHVVSYDPIPSSIWGFSPVMRLFDIQRAITNAFVAQVGDMQLSGMHAEVNPDRLHYDDKLDATAILPRKVRLVKTDHSQGKRAYDIHHVPANSEQFRASIEAWHNKAFELIGIPRMTLGESQGSGTVGRTAGGVASMLNQASKVLRQVLRNMETNVIESVVQGIIDDKLQDNPPENIRGDVNVMARGLTGLIEREGQVEALQWQLQSLAAFAEKVDPETGKPIIPSTVPLHLVYQMFKAKGYKTDGIFPDFDDPNAQTGSPTPMGGMPSPEAASPLTPQTMPLDGRSQVSQASIAQSNNPMGTP
jgi:hypothetical protein